jgi:hypothetical protein
VDAHHLDAWQEALNLEYPSYIFALAMGAGKTVLIGAIVATEFAMALQYHSDGDGPFMQNALVFAPGLTILDSLRELTEVPYGKILPPHLYLAFAPSYKLIFTRNGEKDVPVLRGSRYNLVVTNTEKIRIQKRTYRHHTWSDMYAEHMLEEYAAEANLRLRAIASLPNLGVFSDEAHHTYGSEAGKRLKRVRQTVDYLHENTDLVYVVNTTGTPYYQRRVLPDVVMWYGLSQAIRDGILKSVADSIYAYDWGDVDPPAFIAEVVRDFFSAYGDVTLPDGAPAKLAIYFPQTKDLRDLRPVVEQTLIAMGYPTDLVLRNTSNSTEAEIAAFNRLNDPDAPHRVILLVNKGTEGWNCPSLFACALARTLKDSRNFVLQAASRCLRQVPGNDHPARIYLSMSNRHILDRQIRDTFGETVADISAARYRGEPDPVAHTSASTEVGGAEEPRSSGRSRHDAQPIVSITVPPTLALTRPEIDDTTPLRRIYTTEVRDGQQVGLTETGAVEVSTEDGGDGVYSVAVDLAARYRLSALDVLRALKDIYGPYGVVPDHHRRALAVQIESQIHREVTPLMP